MHGLTDEVFAQDGTERGLAIATTGKGRAARPLQVKVATPSKTVDQLTQKQRTAIAELGREAPKLVACIGHGERVRAGEFRHAGQTIGDVGVRGLLGIQVEELSGLPVEMQQALALQRCRRQPRVKNVGQASVAVVEAESVECRHRRMIAAEPRR